ncbi:NAD(P)-binding domain-containing protein [Nocardia asiatica]|uniref:imine reductase family protein n=1 Tax=Nocardia asiatica TaxID=209252 RepID=UPI003EE27DA0
MNDQETAVTVLGTGSMGYALAEAFLAAGYATTVWNRSPQRAAPLGAEPDLAALYESAVGATLLPALLGFFEGAAVLAARGLAARTMVPYSIKWLQMIESLLPVMADEIDNRDYTRLGSSIALFHTALGDDERLGAESGVDMSWHAPMHDLLHRAVAEGRGEQSITALIELLARDRGRVDTLDRI